MMFETALWMPTDVSVSRLAEVAKLADEEGYDYFLVPDEGLTRDVFVALTAVALNTKRIQFGPAIINPYTRHPITSAVAMASLDELSGGRAFMGYGIGGSLVLGPLGYTIERPLRICREAIEITRMLFSGEPVTYNGEFFKCNDVRVRFDVRPMPIYFASRGSQMLRLGGELTDGQFLSGKAKFDLQRTKDDIMAGAQKSGRKPKIFYAVHVAYNPQLIQDIKANYTYMIVDSPEHVQKQLGLSEAQIEQIHSVMIRDGIRKAGELITDELLMHFIVMGDDEVCAREIVRLMRQYEFDVFTLPVPNISNLSEMVQRISRIIRLAKEMWVE